MAEKNKKVAKAPKEKIIANGSGGGSTGGDGAGASGGGGGGSAPKLPNFKVSKLSLNPSRKINLGNYSTVDLNAGMEVVFDEPVYINSQEVKDALTQMRKVIRDEFKEQYAPYMKKKEAKKSE